MIHRAIYGSLERFIGILIEHYEGKFPLWITPNQIRILTVTEKVTDYAKNVNRELLDSGYEWNWILESKNLELKSGILY